MSNKYPKCTTSARLAWGAVLIGTVLEVIASLVPIAILKVILSFLACGIGFLIIALIHHKQESKTPVILAAIVAMVVGGTISLIFGSLGGEVAQWIEWGRVSIDSLIYGYGGIGWLFGLCGSVFAYLGIFYMLASWFDETFKDALVKVGLLSLVVVTVIVICSAVWNGSFGGSSKTDQCGICQGSGLVIEGFIDFKTCPVCNGSGVDFH